MIGQLEGHSTASASVRAVGNLAIDLEGLSSLASSVRAVGSMSAEISTYTPLSPQTLSAAVWNSVASQYVEDGTMGKLLNASGGGSDPETIAVAVWKALSASNSDPNTMGRALVEIFALMGLDPTKPLVASSDRRRVPTDGSMIDQTIETDPIGVVTVTRQ